MSKKLVRATVPMCSHCENKTDDVPGGIRQYCQTCDCIVTPVPGCYVDDTVDEVVAEMRHALSVLNTDCDCRLCRDPRALEICIAAWADMLEDRND